MLTKKVKKCSLQAVLPSTTSAETSRRMRSVSLPLVSMFIECKSVIR